MVVDTSVGHLPSDMPRWGQLGMRFAQLLMRRPRVADVCRYLVLSVPWPEPPYGAVLLRCQDDGYLEVLGWFGYPKEVVEAYRRISLFDDLPLTKAARTREPVALYCDSEVASEYPQLRGETNQAQALLVVPLLSDLGSIGVLGVSFHRAVDPAGPTLAVLESVAPLLGLFVELTMPQGLVSGRTPPPVDSWSDSVLDYEQATVADGLTKRQLRVLGMLAKKMSNREIALALDYSVSTIRLDTMAIFRHFGVQGRRDAVEEARRRGII